VAGGAAINRGEGALRFSDDLDIFHDAAASVAASAEADAKALRETGRGVAWTPRGEGIFKAEVSRGEDRVRLDWTTDSAFRFFPVQPDEDFGYCVHLADLPTNKVLALAVRRFFADFACLPVAAPGIFQLSTRWTSPQGAAAPAPPTRSRLGLPSGVAPMFAVFGLGPSEMIVLAAIGLLLFGNRLPDLARSVGKSMKELQNGLRDVEGDLR
jgi:TatA/E family protein of Tat protein translocase